MLYIIHILIHVWIFIVHIYLFMKFFNFMHFFLKMLLFFISFLFGGPWFRTWNSNGRVEYLYPHILFGNYICPLPPCPLYQAISLEVLFQCTIASLKLFTTGWSATNIPALSILFYPHCPKSLSQSFELPDLGLTNFKENTPPKKKKNPHTHMHTCKS